MAFRADDISINTIIGAGSVVSGDLSINGFVRIDGDIDGNLTTDGNIIVGEKARIRGNLKAKSVVVGGIVLGDINAAESVKILTNSIVVGDVITRKVQLDEKSVLNGHCIAIKDEAGFSEKSSVYFQSKAIREKVSFS